MADQYEREEEQIDRDEESGLISHAEANKQRRELQRAYRDDAQEAAERAYRNELDRW